MRASPAVRFAVERDGLRVYRARLVNPSGNLYMTVASPDSFYSVALMVVDARGRHVALLAESEGRVWEQARLINGLTYCPLQEFPTLLGDLHQVAPPSASDEHGVQVVWQRKRAILKAGQRQIEIRPDKSVALVEGRPVTLTKPPKLLKGRMWLHVRDYFACAMYLIGIPPAAEDKGKVTANLYPMETNFDERRALVTVKVPFRRKLPSLQ